MFTAVCVSVQIDTIEAAARMHLSPLDAEAMLRLAKMTVRALCTCVYRGGWVGGWVGGGVGGGVAASRLCHSFHYALPYPSLPSFALHRP